MTTKDLLERVQKGVWEFNCIFNAFYEASNVILDERIPTACVSLDTSGNIAYRFNPDFAESIDDYFLTFVFCHETLHIMLNHLVRGLDVEDRRKANRAMDIVINHTLCREFGFDRDKIDGWEEYCWVDTCFPEDDLPPENKSWEYYYRILKDGQGKTVDLHNWGSDGFGSGELVDIPDVLKGQIGGKVRELIGQMAGSEALGEEFFLDAVAAKKKKWETLIKKCLMTLDQKRYVEQWVFPNNRAVFLQENCIPQSSWCITSDEDRIDLVFFIDLSASCKNFYSRFLKAAKSIPSERFRVSAYSFDTKVYPADIRKGVLKGGGGTSFSILENHVLRMKRYPDMIFVLTDGFGDLVTPLKPDRWIWLLTEGGGTNFIEGMKYFNLSDFE